MYMISKTIIKMWLNVREFERCSKMKKTKEKGKNDEKWKEITYIKNKK
jgi:hypothetical protein